MLEKCAVIEPQPLFVCILFINLNIQLTILVLYLHLSMSERIWSALLIVQGTECTTKVIASAKKDMGKWKPYISLGIKCLDIMAINMEVL